MTGFVYRPQYGEEPSASPYCCNPETQTFCNTGYILYKQWSRAELVYYQYGTRQGLSAAKRAWENHLNERTRI